MLPLLNADMGESSRPLRGLRLFFLYDIEHWRIKIATTNRGSKRLLASTTELQYCEARMAGLTPKTTASFQTVRWAKRPPPQSAWPKCAQISTLAVLLLLCSAAI